MIEKIKILVVEDDADQAEAYIDAAKDLDTEEFAIELVVKTSAPDARSELLSSDFDGAIVDLNLSSGDPGEASGNKVLLEITGKHRFPVFVVSGNLQNLDAAIECSGFLKTFNRDTSNDEIFNEFIRIHATGITRILGGRGKIEKHLGEIFWRHLAQDFDHWDAGGRDSEKTLLRYAVAHLAEYLDLPSDDEKEHHHEAEFYVIPPIRPHIATGDILEHGGNRYIVLSPPCDVAIRDIENEKPVINAGSILLAPLIRIDRQAFDNAGLIHSTNDNSNGRAALLAELIKGQREKYVFLPGYRGLYPAIANLQNPKVWSLDQFLGATRLATVAGAFLKDIQSRFAAYYGRQGQPDLDKSGLVKKYKALLTPQPQ